ncbi:radical SAM protein [Kitasatospora sp. NPDC088346]|uniref:radical SAM protein n=1 Tax=Kitasatospora sp. NPDC088346 TaxID=3364073 RepID=UPI003810002C
MHLADLLTLGARPAAGLLLALTDRCPLACAHCSTASTMDSAQSPGEPFRRLVHSFEPDCRPELILMSGGEPLLRPGLVADLTAAAARAGTGAALLSGMFFARGGAGLPPAIRRAVAGLAHFAASLDAQHEREVGRAEVFGALTAVLDLVPAVSLHVTAPPGAGPDPYVDGLVADVRRRFGARVPMLVSAVRPTGRARGLLPAPGPGRTDPGPCEFAHWPLVDQDGTVLACTRQSLLRDGGPPHLILGHAARDSWRTLAARTLGDPLLRSVRTLGPVGTRQRHGPPDAPGCAPDACRSCLALTPATAARAAAVLATPAGQRMERAVLALTAARAPRRLAAARGALPGYADLVELGWAG